MQTNTRIICLISLLFIHTALCGQTSDLSYHLIHELQEKQSALGRNIQIRKMLRQDLSFAKWVHVIKSNKHKITKPIQTGQLKWTHRIDSLEHHAIAIIPPNYNPQKKYPVDFILHGAVSTPNPHAVDKYVQITKSELAKAQHIVVYPSGWLLSPWWSKSQLQHLDLLLRKLKENYNVDENRVFLSGISDGGTGCAYVANHAPTPWACYLPYISYPAGVPHLSNEPLYLKNLPSNTFYFISTQNDQLFPPKRIHNFSTLLKAAGIKHKLSVVPDHDHDVTWFANYKDSIRQYKREHTRNPYPDTISWHCHDMEYGRNHWVVIEKINKRKRENCADVIAPEGEKTNYYGSIAVKRKGNRIEVHTTHVKQFRLLLSPEQFNFNKPIEVYTNGKCSFHKQLQPDAKTLLKWYWQDLDRTMLFGAEIRIKV